MLEDALRCTRAWPIPLTPTCVEGKEGHVGVFSSDHPARASGERTARAMRMNDLVWLCGVR